ncbi:DUF6162 family protein [Motilimonas cestriensis]|uniref:DUF6162 family protein n=1 Tax=Motilimonas cestriensis TaxID=2742685 RepID=UPI003DA28068
MSVQQVIHAANGVREMRWVALVITLLVVIGAGLLPFHQAQQQGRALASHEVDVNQLDPNINAMVSELRLADMEIQLLKAASASGSAEHWPSIAQLEAMWLSPFVRDKGWLDKGQHQWQQISPGVYQGISLSAQTYPQYLLNVSATPSQIWFRGNIGHGHEEADIKAKSASSYINVAINDNLLIKQGWQQVMGPRATK